MMIRSSNAQNGPFFQTSGMITTHATNGGNVKNASNSIYDSQFMIRLKKMYEEKRFTDAAIMTVGRKPFEVHKVVLAAHSTVFAAMFESDFSESDQNQVLIKDFGADVVEKFINFLYAGKCDFSEDAGELLAIAEKYDVQELKAAGEEFLANGLKIENAAQTLQLAALHRADTLKETTLRFIVENLIPVMSTEGWKSMTTELLNQVLRATAI